MRISVVLLIFVLGINCISCTDKEKNEFQTPDLALFALKGKVKECRTYYFEAIDGDNGVVKGDSLRNYLKDELRYSAGGEIIYISNYGTLACDEITIKRNSAGRIVEICRVSPVSEEEGGGTFTRGEGWEYDVKGRPCRNTCYDDVEGNYGDIRFEYNEANDISKVEDKGRFSCVSTFQYLEFDEHNNWTKRITTRQEEMSEPRKQFEERVITYY